jgi:hypothetical protein
MLSFLLPGELKRQLDAAVIAFIDRQTETFLPEPVREKIRRLSPQLVAQKALDDAVQRAIVRFAREYPDIDEDLAAAVLAVADFWDNVDVRTALLSLVSHPGMPRPEERTQIATHFDTVLPERRNRERVDRAISYVLRLVAMVSTQYFGDSGAAIVTLPASVLPKVSPTFAIAIRTGCCLR